MGLRTIPLDVLSTDEVAELSQSVCRRTAAQEVGAAPLLVTLIDELAERAKTAASYRIIFDKVTVLDEESPLTGAAG